MCMEWKGSDSLEKTVGLRHGHGGDSHLREYFENRKNKLLEQVSSNNPEVESTLKEIFDKALTGAFEDMEKNGVQPDSEECFWAQLSQMLLDCGYFRYGYRYFYDMVDTLYLEMESCFGLRCWPPQEDLDWKEYTSYAEMRRMDEGNRYQYFTVVLPAEPTMLQDFLTEQGLDDPQKCDTRYVHIGGLKWSESESVLPQCGTLMELNYLFYRLDQLSLEQKRCFDLTAYAKGFEDVKDLINLTANMDGLIIQHDITTEKMLGRFLVENEICFPDASEELLEYLDYEKIAQEHMKATGGRIVCGIYIEDILSPEEQVELYDGVHLPDFTLEQEESAEETQGFDGGMVL